MNLTEVLKDHAREHGSDIAIIDRVQGRSRSTTFREFDESIDQLSRMFRQHGLRAGQTVLLLQPMSADLYISLGAILRAGMTVMFVNPFAGRRSIEKCCQLHPPHAMVSSVKGHLLRLLSPAIRRIPIRYSFGGWVPGAKRVERYADYQVDGEVQDCDPDSPALVSFTSGNSGEAKATIRTHSFLAAQHQAVAQHLSLQAGETELVTMPIFVLANLASRLTSVLADVDLTQVGNPDPDRIITQIRDHDVNRVTASPAFLTRILDHCERHELHLDSLKRILTGGGPVSPRLMDRLRRIAPRASVHAVYGSSEVEPISKICFSDLPPDYVSNVRAGSGLLVGEPVDSLSVRVIRDQWETPIDRLSSDQFKAMTQPTGCPGEIVVSGEHVLDCYADENLTVINKFSVDGTRWHRTGDAGYFDQQGRLWLVGRCSARIDDRHGTLYPLTVEQAAATNPSVSGAACVSMGDERVLAVTAVPDSPPPNVDSILQHLPDTHIDRIKVLSALPVDRRHQSKIDYKTLRERLAS